MKLLSLFALILMVVPHLEAQSPFSFNRPDSDNGKAVQAKFVHESEMLEAIQPKKLDYTGPFHVFHDYVNHSINIQMTNVFDVLNYEIQNVNGVKVNTSGRIHEQTVLIDLDQLPKGIYVLKLKGSQKTFTTKIQHGI